MAVVTRTEDPAVFTPQISKFPQQKNAGLPLCKVEYRYHKSWTPKLSVSPDGNGESS